MTVRIDPLDRGFLVGDCVFDVARLLRAWSEIVGVDIVAQARHYAPLERLESPRGS
jgi:hypothetical protein